MSRLQELESELQAIMKEGFTSAEAYEHFEAVRAECRQLAFDQRSQGGDFAGALMLCDSQEVAGSIVRLAPLMTDNTLRDILRSEWPRCEAHKPYRREMVELLSASASCKTERSTSPSRSSCIAGTSEKKSQVGFPGHSSRKPPSGFLPGHSLPVRRF